ncbi:MAG: hypothetical protein C4523_12425 [Myxococcales bacterium]|nr:MAG: hypothetical protein C4523_12425 [Myxococcales bacterium]
MAQLFLWTHKIDEALREEFQLRFGAPAPEALLDLHESLPGEFIRFLGFYPMEEVLSEERRPPFMMPGLVPFGEDRDGDYYCFYIPWRDGDGRVPYGVWMHETGHFLPFSYDMRAFLVWWLGRQVLDSLGGDDWPEMRRILELFQGAVGLEETDLILTPPASDLAWHSEILKIDPAGGFSLSLQALRTFAAQGFDATLAQFEAAERSMPTFGAASLWQARLLAMRGATRRAHEAYFRHLGGPMFANGYHYLWDAGDLMVPEVSEVEALEFIYNAETPPPDHLLAHPKIDFFREHDPANWKDRIAFAKLLEQRQLFAAALAEMENAFFLEGWNEAVAKELLETLLCIYPEQNRIREAEQCRMALAKLAESPPSASE